MLRRLLAVVCLTALVVVLLAVPTSTATSASTPVTPGVVPSDIATTYLARRPPLGDVTVIDVSGESADRKLLAATLQGIVNRTEVRIYLLGMRSVAEDQHWLDWYQHKGLIHVVATVSLDTALSTFAGELAGYVVADDAEPWTINTATTAAGVLGGVVVTPATIGAAQSAGLTQLDDQRGRWPDAATAYKASAATYRNSLGEQAVAIQAPDRHQPRDLFVQQGMFVVYTRPSRSDFDQIYNLIDTFPTDHPVYGYISDTGTEEVTAILRLSQQGRFLVPTDTTDNLSFHLAVGGAVRAQAPQVNTDVAPCTSSKTNIVLSVGDGDNMVVPESTYLQSRGLDEQQAGRPALRLGDQRGHVGADARGVGPVRHDRHAERRTGRHDGARLHAAVPVARRRRLFDEEPPDATGPRPPGALESRSVPRQPEQLGLVGVGDRRRAGRHGAIGFPAQLLRLRCAAGVPRPVRSTGAQRAGRRLRRVHRPDHPGGRRPGGHASRKAAARLVHPRDRVEHQLRGGRRRPPPAGSEGRPVPHPEPGLRLPAPGAGPAGLGDHRPPAPNPTWPTRPDRSRPTPTYTG